MMIFPEELFLLSGTFWGGVKESRKTCIRVNKIHTEIWDIVLPISF